MNPDYDYYADKPSPKKWWRLYKDGVVYTFSETSGDSKATAGKIRVESSVGKSGVYEKNNARVFWNSLIANGYVLGKQGETPNRSKYDAGSYADIYEELVNAVEEVSCKIDPNYKRWKKEYDKEYGIDTYANYALEA